MENALLVVYHHSNQQQGPVLASNAKATRPWMDKSDQRGPCGVNHLPGSLPPEEWALSLCQRQALSFPVLFNHLTHCLSNLTAICSQDTCSVARSVQQENNFDASHVSPRIGGQPRSKGANLEGEKVCWVQHKASPCHHVSAAKPAAFSPPGQTLPRVQPLAQLQSAFSHSTCGASSGIRQCDLLSVLPSAYCEMVCIT